MKWLAGWNMPGCLPETDPAEFDEWSDARDHLVSEMNRWLDDEINPEFPDAPPSANEVQLASTIRDLECAAADDIFASRTTAGYVFWIMPGSQKRSDDDYLGELADAFWSVRADAVRRARG